MPDSEMWVHNFLTTMQFSSLFDLREVTKISWWNKNITVVVFIMICQYYDNLENNLYNMIRRYQNILKIHSKKVIFIEWLWTPWYVSRTDCIILYWDRVAGFLFERVYNITSGNINSAFHGLDLAAVHEQEKWYYHFCCNLELREGQIFL